MSPGPAGAPPPTLVLPPRYTPDTIAVGRAAGARGWEVERLASWRAPEYLRDRELVLYGEPLFAVVVAEPLGLALVEPALSWLAGIPRELTLRDVTFGTLAQARGVSAPAFIKPAEDKCFPARVYATGKELRQDDLLPGTTPVLVSEPVEWVVEFRAFVLDGRPLTLSPYWREGKLAQAEDGSWPATKAESEAALATATGVASNPRSGLPEAVALDVGLIRDRGWAVVEANAAWGSGVYGCDLDAVLDVLRRSCHRRQLRGCQAQPLNRPPRPVD